MQFIWDVSQTANWVLGLVVLILLLGFCSFAVFKVVHRKIPGAIIGAGDILLLLFYIIYIPAVFLAVACMYTTAMIIICMINLGNFRKFLSNPFGRANTKAISNKVEKIFDRDEMYKQIETAVINLSKTKTGAIITFERNTSLKDVISNGVVLNAPITAELLETIFYPGTRLHDGAVVIHGNMIIAAAVFYTPTTKTFAGKYGSRHRAGIGISEISDAITVIVSEESGRISFAINGQLETVDQSNFLRVFENYMSSSDN